VRLKLIQNKWLGDGHGFVSLPRARACVATVYRGLIVAESRGPLSASCPIYFLPLFVLMLRMTGALGLRIRRRILRLRILRVRRGICRRRLARCGRHDHARAVAQAVCAVDRNPLTDRHAGIDRCHWAIGRADIDRSDRQPVVGVDDVDVTSRCAALDGGGRHRDDIMQRLHQKLRVDELIRTQRIVSIVELRSHFHGTGGGIDLAVIAATRPVASILTLARS
jgi:hypothetical protein